MSSTPQEVDGQAGGRSIEDMEEILESKVGKVCIILYTLFAIISYIYAASCGAESCALVMVWPILPWAFILASDIGVSFTWAMYPVFVLLNASVAYVFGSGIEWLYNWYTNDRTETEDVLQEETSLIK